MAQPVTLTGPLPAALANSISDAIHEALRRGMHVDEAVGVVVGVAADYGRLQYGNEYLEDLAAVVIERRERPFPDGTAQNRRDP
jgi:hypothetical protein